MIVLKHRCIAAWATELDRSGHSLVSAAALELFVGWTNLSIFLDSLGTGRGLSRPRLEAPVAICLRLIQNFHDLNRD